MRRVHIAVIACSIISLASVAYAASTAIECDNDTAPCISYQNTGQGSSANYQGTSGFGSRASSQTGTGLEGKSSSGSFLNPGVEGESQNPGTNDAAGTFGVTPTEEGSAPPAYGAVGYGGTYGVAGEVFPDSSNAGAVAAGVYALDSKTAVESETAYHSALLAQSSAKQGIGILAIAGSDSPTRIQPNQLVGIYGIGDGGIGELVESNTSPLVVVNNSENTEADFMNGDNILAGYKTTNNVDVAKEVSIDTSGNETLNGTLTTSKGTYVSTRGSDGTKMTAYGARTTAPRIEDDGEARLVDGSAVVRLDAQIADVIDRRVSYMVFITPDGDSNGLYVTQRTPVGFVVREQRGGHSTLDFSYRIVAKPVDEDGRRLALVAEHVTSKPALSDAIGHPSVAPLSPDQRERKALGAAKYASLLRQIQRAHGQK